jgi:hypothetical protein
MTPQVEYYAKANITQASGLKNLKTVDVYVYYDALGSDPEEPGAPDPQTCAQLTWTASPESWTIDAGGSVTWSIVQGDCSRPSNLNDTTGNWVFAFVVGKVATETAWFQPIGTARASPPTRASVQELTMSGTRA